MKNKDYFPADGIHIYLNCKNKEIQHCDFFMVRSCPESCAYARDIRGLGIGGIGAICDSKLLKKLNSQLTPIKRSS